MTFVKHSRLCQEIKKNNVYCWVVPVPVYQAACFSNWFKNFWYEVFGSPGPHQSLCRKRSFPSCQWLDNVWNIEDFGCKDINILSKCPGWYFSCWIVWQTCLKKIGNNLRMVPSKMGESLSICENEGITHFDSLTRLHEENIVLSQNFSLEMTYLPIPSFLSDGSRWW